MNLPKIQIPPELVAAGKHLFEETHAPMQDIATMMGISPDTLRRRSCEWCWKQRQRRWGGRASRSATDGPPRGSVTRSGGPIAAARRRMLAARIMTMLEGELARIETTFKHAGASAEGAFDNRIRALLGVTKMLREVELMSKPDEVIPPDAVDNDTPIDEFRDALARRIDAFVAARQNTDGGPDGGAAG